jgi:hypothetical protein
MAHAILIREGAMHPTAETKIELVTEAIETLVLAAVAAQIPKDQFPSERAARHKNIADARQCVHDALCTLMTPTLRVVAPVEPPTPVERPLYPGGIDDMNLG